MAILDGDKFESILWREGYDYDFGTNDLGDELMVVWSEDVRIYLGEVLEDGDSWVFDTDALFSGFGRDTGTHTPVEGVATEEELFDFVQTSLGEA